MKTKPTVAGKLEVVTFKKFIELLPVEEVDAETDIYSFNIVRDNNPFKTHSSNGSIVLRDGELDQVLKMHLISQAHVKPFPRKNIDHMAEDAASAHYDELGSPTHMVRISRRMWLVANPKDFRLVKSNLGNGLACHHRPRTLVYIVNRRDR